MNEKVANACKKLRYLLSIVIFIKEYFYNLFSIILDDISILFLIVPEDICVILRTNFLMIKTSILEITCIKLLKYAS